MDIPGCITLPKGILTNSSTVYDEVAAYSTLPAEKVHQYWHVYTTTNKKLKDPTARRLENFWWHVWGSNRSKLSGPLLAQIFQDISLGPTVVPLRGPPNRWEGPDAAPLTVEMIMAHIQRNLHSDAGKISTSTTRRHERAAARVSSGALRPSQLPPILKKAGSSSTNMTRHTATARFISPHKSAEEDDAENDVPSSGSTLGTGFDTPALAITHTNKTNPKNSQLPTAHTGLTSTLSATRNQLTCNGTPARQAHQNRSNGQPNTSSSEASRQRTRRTTPNPNSLTQDAGKEPSTAPAGDKFAGAKHKATRRSKQEAVPDHAELPMTKPTRSLFTAATSSTTNVAVQGTIIDQSGSIPSVPQILTSNFPKVEPSSHEGSSPSLRETRLTPTQPSNSVVLPLGRTKSQLTLLLEREKERSRS